MYLSAMFRRLGGLGCCGALLAVLLCVPAPARAQDPQISPQLMQGIRHYEDESFEEAVETLSRVRRQEPDNTLAAFFLGLSYKQVMDYERALEHLEAAVSQAPRIKEALVELVDTALILGRPETAATWIAEAEAEGIQPAKIAFLKGQMLAKQGETEAAVGAFEKAGRLDPDYRQQAELQIAMTLAKARRFKAARERLAATVLLDPQSDLAGFARNYQDVVEKRIEMERPLHLAASVFGQHNDNLLTTPGDSAFRTAGESPLSSNALLSSLRLSYTPLLDGPWVFSGQWAGASTLNDERSTSRDSLNHSLSLVPGYDFGRFSLNLVAGYSYAQLRAPDYKGYVEAVNAGPMVRTILSDTQLLEVFGNWAHTEYVQPPLANPDEDRDARTWTGSLSWLWLYTDGGLFNLRYEYINENAQGRLWANTGHRLAASLTVPLVESLALQVSGSMHLQDFDNPHTLLNDREPREDETYTGSAGLTWAFLENTSLVLQYNYTRADSNIGFYDYDQETIQIGIEYRY